MARADRPVGAPSTLATAIAAALGCASCSPSAGGSGTATDGCATGCPATTSGSSSGAATTLAPTATTDASETSTPADTTTVGDTTTGGPCEAPGCVEPPPPVDCALTTCYFVRPGANGDGSDWDNAFAELPAQWVRGATYLVAGGDYPSFTFDAEHSGTDVVTVKKATPTDHGTEVGWVADYGVEQAVFASQIVVERGYFVLDGSYRDEFDWFDGDAYGFAIANQGEWQHLIIRDPNGLLEIPDVTIRYLFIAAIVGELPPGGEGYRPYAIDTDTYSSEIRNVGYVFSRVFVDGSNNPFFVRTLTDPIVEYCASWRTSGSATFHGEVVNRFYSGSGGGIIRFNHFRDAYNGVSGYPAGGGTGVIAISETSGALIHGNIFENYYVGDGAIAAGWPNDDIEVYNNTIIGGSGHATVFRFPQNDDGTGNVATNNLIVDTTNSSLCNGSGTCDGNAEATTAVFADAAARDYHLAMPTAAGAELAADGFLDHDMDGRLRGADGNWDMGAFEYSPE